MIVFKHFIDLFTLNVDFFGILGGLPGAYTVQTDLFSFY